MTLHNDFEFLLNKFAHELRNPLTSAYSTVQLIEMQHPEVKDYKYWSSLGSDLEYMNQLISELSSLSKANRLQPKAFSSKAMLEHVALSFAASIAQSEVEFTSNLSASLPIITADEIKLKEVFRNLLQNAYEASIPNKTIYLDASATEKELVVRIVDTGCGFVKQNFSTFFDPFVTTKKNGTGIGLAVCDQVVKAHNGTIQVESEPDKGSAFTVRIPLVSNVSFEDQSEV